jgi:thiol-disulfide isomerase/thioredoxin
LIVVSMAAFAGGLYLSGALDRAATAPAVEEARAAAASARRPDFAFPDQHGRLRRLADWDGKVVVVNFWATWCAPCLEEIPILIELQEAYAERGVQFVGVAVDELEPVREYAGRVGLNYPTAQGDAAALDVMRRFGNRKGGLPFTAFVDRRGGIAHRHTGPITRRALAELLDGLL